MEDPVAEVPRVIHLLTQSIPSVQRATIEKYFTPSASFTHPFCRTSSFEGSRWLIIRVYRFYKIMSPQIDLEVKSVAFDSTNLILYVTVSQIFRIFIVPFYEAPVTLTTVLKLSPSDEPTSENDPPSSQPVPQIELTNANVDNPESQRLPSPSPSTRRVYHISSQEDLYQTSEFIKFVVPYGVGSTLVFIWHMVATAFSVLLSFVLAPIAWVEEMRVLPANKHEMVSVFSNRK